MRPRESENHCGPRIPKNPSTALTAPPLRKMNRKTTLMATELVTDGKKKAVRKKDFPLSRRWLTTSASVSDSTVCSGTTTST